MIRLFERLKPAFFKAWDKRLLLNRPALWATKFHYALVFGGLGLLLSSLIVWLMPFELSALPNANYHFAYALIPSLMGLAIWIWQVSLFKTEKAFGEAGTPRVLRDQVIYALILALAIGLPVLHNYRVSDNISNAIETETLTADINHLNLMSGYTATFRQWKEEPLSLRESYEDYGFTRYSHYYYMFGIEKAYTIREKFLKLSQPENKTSLVEGLSKYIELVDKYSQHPVNTTGEKLLQNFYLKGFKSEKNTFYPSDLKIAEKEARLNLEKIQVAKANELDLIKFDSWRAPIILFLWGFGLLLIGFQTNGRSFLLSLLIGGGLSMGAIFLADILSNMLANMKQESWMASFYLGGMLLLGIGVLRRKTSQKAILWRQIILSLFVAGLCFLPYAVAQLLPEFGNTEFQLKVIDWMYDDTVMDFLIIGGAALPLILWNFGLRQRFVRLYAHPKSN